MNTQTIAIADATLSIIGAAVFTILFIMIHASLKKCEMFSGWAVVILSICAACLSTIGMGQMFLAPQASVRAPVSNESPGMPIVVFPYTVLGVFLLLMFLLMLLGKLFGSGKTDKCVKKVFPTESTNLSEHGKEPVPSLDWLMTQHEKTGNRAHINPDQTLRDINTIDQMAPQEIKPFNNKGIRHEK